MKRVLCAAAAIAGLGAAQHGLAEPNMQPGLWETTVRTEMAGMPMQIPPVTHRQCIRKEDMVPRVESSDQDCRIVDQTTEGDTVTWRIQCDSNEMQMTGRGKLTYAGDTYSGRMEMQAQGGPMGAMSMVQKMDGQRVGDCP